MAEAVVGVNHHAAVDEDRVYNGSRFSEVLAAISENPYQRIWGAPGEPALPVREVSFRTVVGGLIRGVSARQRAYARFPRGPAVGK